ncbi:MULTISPECIES: glycosyltransferase family 8 protein [unclassified Snodgrassella]|uniref:glycosyltransferase family 8 protein n=1 Tax=unclassified Snodgrassella TaxID=2625236 RepID=UPI0018DD3A38|nr:MULTISPECIES: glycosyltransferase [Snodgrassella]MBI0068333.1 hypothetical protein [Snodgrassella sp. M0110]MBI0077795.1 hypothetical protein [Snodgrassella sp. M0118]MBI0079712.1 hypothetical protein [Snodgrassella sp. M0112]
MIDIKGCVEDKKVIAFNGKEVDNPLHVLLCFDDKYAFPAGINMYSIIHNNPNRELHFHLFMQNVSVENQSKIAELSSKFVSITQYSINNKFRIHSNNTKFFPISACLRIIAPLIISQNVKKLLYIDSDTICLSSLDELFNTDLNDKIIAAVADVENTQVSQCKKFQLEYGSYFNSGVMLYNLENWNEANITKLALNLLNEGIEYKFPDQDVLNILLKDKIYFVPKKFNSILYTAQSFENKQKVEKEAVEKGAVIIHYTAGCKPWFKLHLTPIYKKYIYDSPWKNTKLLLANNPSTLRRYSKYLLRQHKYFRSFFYYMLYLKHKILKV